MRRSWRCTPSLLDYGAWAREMKFEFTSENGRARDQALTTPNYISSDFSRSH